MPSLRRVPPFASPAQLELFVDLLGQLLQARLEIGHVAGEVLVDECTVQRGVRQSQRRDLLVAGVRVREDLREGGEVLVTRQRRVL